MSKITDNISSFFSGHEAPVVNRVDSAIRWINLYPMDSAIGFASTYSLNGELSGEHESFQ